MARQMSPAMLAAIQSNNILPAIFCSILFQTGAVYLWTGYGSIVWGGNTWQGIGNLGEITTVEEGADVQARQVVLSLSGFDADLVSLLLTELKVGSPAALYLGLFSASPPALLADPIPIWAGRTDQNTIEVGGETASVSLNCESRLLDLNSNAARRYTNDDQRLDYPQDAGLQFVYSIMEVIISWGAKPTSALNNR